MSKLQWEAFQPPFARQECLPTCRLESQRYELREGQTRAGIQSVSILGRRQPSISQTKLPDESALKPADDAEAA